VPRGEILDVVTLLNTLAFWEQYGFVLCPVQVSPDFDTSPAFILENGPFMSVVRKPLGTLLLRSRSTVNDFEIVTVPTPGSVP
jgi:hypothetical protein